MKRIFTSSTLIVLIIATVLAIPSKSYGAVAANFKAGNLIDDSKFTDKTTMTAAMIQDFLNFKRPSCQAGYTCLKDFQENGKSAAQIIFEKSQEFSINPQVMLVLLEKEQGLVTRSNPGSYEYRFATGYCVYDSSPPPQCAGTDGFTNQIHYSAKMFRGIMDGTRSANFLVGNNNILYNPNSNCGAPTVFIENKATTALYTYTPYQPNAAALNNLYGEGDSCSSYGNRNFWRLFSDWFGPPTGEGYVLATSNNNNGDPRQWVLYKGIKRHVPDETTLKAWGLDSVPLAQMTGLQLGAIPNQSALGRLFRPTGTLDVYFADGGNCYRVQSQDMMAAWNFSTGAIQDVSIELGRVPANHGNLTYSIINSSAPGTVYYVDGGTLRRYGSDDIYAAWEGSGKFHQSISQEYLSLMGSGAPVATKGGRYGNQSYLMSKGTVFMTTDPNIAELWGVSQPLGFLRPVVQGFSPFYMMTRFARSMDPGDTRLFAVDRGQLYHLSPEHASNLGLTPGMPLMAIDPETITNPINPWAWIVVKDLSGKNYVIDNGNKRPFPNNDVQNFWTNNGAVFVPTMSNGFLNLLPTKEAIERGLIGSGPKVFVIEGVMKRWIQNPDTVSAYAPIQRVSDVLLTAIPNGPNL